MCIPRVFSVSAFRRWREYGVAEGGGVEWGWLLRWVLSGFLVFFGGMIGPVVWRKCGRGDVVSDIWWCWNCGYVIIGVTSSS